MTYGGNLFAYILKRQEKARWQVRDCTDNDGA